MTSTAPEITDPTQHPETGRTVTEHLEHLDGELRRLKAEDEADPSSTAIDPASWQTRSHKRYQDRLALESERRFVAEFRSLAWRFDKQLAAYVRVARPIQARYKQLLTTWTLADTNNHDVNGRTDVKRWMDALQLLFIALPQSEPISRSILAREFGRWITFRNAFAVAAASDRCGGLPAPEVDGNLPVWLYVGAVRTDLLRPDPALDES